MSDITLRLDKGTPLTNQEVDDNFDNLNADKYESGDSPLFVDIDADTIQLLGGTGTQGTLSWNADEETVDLIQNGATLQLGQEVQIHCRNATGSTISNGVAVYATGTIGNSGRITVAPMIADGTIPAKYVLGITTEEILNGEDGKVTTFGKVRDLDTTAYSDGDVLYVSPDTAGALTATEPTAPDISLPVAFVIHAHANGSLFTRVTPFDENAYATAAQGALADSALQSVPAEYLTETEGDARYLLESNNLSDLTDAATARTNLGLGTAATTNSTAYATAAQGTLADSALQSGDNISELTNNSGYITGNQTITLSGDVSGSGTTSISVTVADDSHNHIIANVDGLQSALDGKVDDSQVLTNVPSGAVFTDTTYSVGNGGLTEINFTSALNSKLAGIEAGATADQTASEILTAIKTVDGSGSGLDADLLDGQQGSYYQPASSAWTVRGSAPSDLNDAGQGLWRINASEANRPAGANYGTLLSFDNTSDTGFQLASDYQGNQFYWRSGNAPVYGGTGSFGAWRQLWHNGNDGSGSGLDADLLDGQQGSYYTGTYTAAHVGLDTSGSTSYPRMFARNNPTSSGDWLRVSSTGGGLLPYSNNNSYVGTSSWKFSQGWFNSINGGTAWTSANDGSGSGLDADLLDGYQLSTTRNAANTVPVRDASGYANFGWINTTSGETSNPITKIYGSYTGDNYLRWFYPSTLISQQGIWTSSNDGSGSGLDADLLDGQHASAFKPDWYSTWAPVSKSQSVWYQMAYDGCIHVAVDVTVYYDVDIGNNTSSYTRFQYKANAGNGSRASAAIPLAKGQWYRVTPNYSSPVGSIYEQRLRG